MLPCCASLAHGIPKPTGNGKTNTPWLLHSSLAPYYAKEEIPSVNFSASSMSSGDRKKGYDTDDTSDCNDNSDMENIFKWKNPPELIISAVTPKTQYGKLNKSGSKISSSGPHGRRCSDYYVGLNEVLDMTESVNPNPVSLFSAHLHFWWNPMETRRTDTLELCLACLSSQPEVSSPPIRSATTVTSMTTIRVNLEVNNDWWPRMEGRVACLSVTG